MKYLLFLFILSCSQFTQNDNIAIHSSKGLKKSLSIVFSHNIHGETEPCGCRVNPLGGLPNVMALFKDIEKESELLYVDTGDMLFPTPVLAKNQTDSLSYAASSVMKAMEILGLKFFIPGELDLAKGKEFLESQVKGSSAQVLLTNGKFLNNKKYALVEYPPHRIFLFGIVNPELFDKGEFEDPFEALGDALDDLKINYSDPFLRIVVLSHSGQDFDTELARRFPQIDWIIGSHDQSFTRDPFKEGNTRIVQVLSRNHYIGEVKFDLARTKGNDKFVLHEVHTELEKTLDPNPMSDFLAEHKKEIKEIQQKEQDRMLSLVASEKPLRTYLSCKECHVKQTEFWSETPHALAMGTLLRVGEHNNQTCIGCHSLGHRDPQGFNKTSEMIHFREAPLAKDIKVSEETRNLEELKKNYFNEFSDIFKDAGVIRELSADKRKEISHKWMKKDEELGIDRNYANVQCLHCHDKNPDHPFQFESKDKGVARLNLPEKCMKCHTSQLSPAWYEKDEKGLPKSPNFKYIQELITKVSCPNQ